jgi:hypothetical protein
MAFLNKEISLGEVCNVVGANSVGAGYAWFSHGSSSTLLSEKTFCQSPFAIDKVLSDNSSACFLN